MVDKLIALRIDKNLDRRIRVEAAKNDLDRSKYIRQALLEKLNDSRVEEKELPVSTLPKETNRQPSTSAVRADA